MQYESTLEKGILIKRYKRFLADIRLPSGDEITIHCPNTGSMRHCAEPGYEVFYSKSENKKRKYAHTWELARDFDGHWIGINTHMANKLAKEAIGNGVIEELQGYDVLTTEVAYGEERSRVDILLQDSVKKTHKRDCYIEVKSVTLLDESKVAGNGYFPDSISERAHKHLRELSGMVRLGHRAVLLYCVQHTGIRSVLAARHIDQAYGDAVDLALKSGVEILVYGCEISADQNVLCYKLNKVSADFNGACEMVGARS